jgi:hypothetical protein
MSLLKGKLGRWLLVLGVVGLGLGWRGYVAQNAPHDFDEDNYLSAARSFRLLIEAGQWSQIPDVTNNQEHPPLVKLLYSLSLDPAELDQIPRQEDIRPGSNLALPANSLQNARWQSVLFSGLTLLLLAVTSPLAALALSGQSLHLYYGSVAYLDALPTLMTALSAALYTYSYAGQAQHYRQLAFWGAAICFGIGVAAKYPFGLIGVALLAHALFYRHAKLWQVIAWGLVAILAFFIFNPYLYPDPMGRVRDQLTFHEAYAQRQEGARLLRPITQLTDPGQFLPDLLDTPLKHGLDLLIFGLASVGVPQLVRQKSVYVWWLLLGMLFLMTWNTQWPQHKLMIIVPYSISAAAGLRWLWAQRPRAESAA